MAFRRPGRRPFFRRPVRGEPTRQHPHPMLIRANEPFLAGVYEKSADIFEKLAEQVISRRGPRAPQLFLQAGRARFYVGQADAGMKLVKKGLKSVAY
ncbi:MAG: hypothetical protein MUO76_12790 [Anaerolineaceae bacterium]|nr:hypothetical protein [Anaerolineaceae bacterium]